jgi:hypothetical protein
MLFVGVVGGFLLSIAIRKFSSKENAAESRSDAYYGLTTLWLKTRNYITDQLARSNNPKDFLEYDNLYGKSQNFLDKIISASKDTALIEDINSYNEKLYTTDWFFLPDAKRDALMESLKTDALSLFKRMREDL